MTTYYVHLFDQQGISGFEIICQSAKIVFQRLSNSNPRSILITSGTLAPMDLLEQNIGQELQIHQGNHVISSSQILPRILYSGINGSNFMFNYSSRTNDDLIKDLGLSINDVCQRISGGMFVFFPSYDIMYDYCNRWQNRYGIKFSKACFTEAKEQSVFNEQLKEYCFLISEKKESPACGALFMGVFRGKLCEGISLPDAACRCVIIVGIPYMYMYDPKLLMKKHYLDKRFSSQKSISGEEFYVMDAIKAVNQAIGRVIRHKDDYGVILFADSRYVATKHKSLLPQWVTKSINTCHSYDDFVADLACFLKLHKQIHTSQSTRVSTSQTISTQLEESSSQESIEKPLLQRICEQNDILKHTVDSFMTSPSNSSTSHSQQQTPKRILPFKFY